jgi:hypothetical protein
MQNAIFKRRRRDIFVERRPEQVSSSVRSGMVAVRKDRPYGAWVFIAGGATKMSPLTGLELARGKPRKHSGLGFSLEAGHADCRVDLRLEKIMKNRGNNAALFGKI